MTEEACRVYLRVRPLNDREKSGNIVLSVDKTNSCCHLSGLGTYTFDHVGDEITSQEEVFRDVCKPIADAVMEGFHGTIFAYGPTGSGKTYTVFGETEDPACPERGIVPRAIDYLFGCIASQENENPGQVEYACKVSFIEIYNEQLHDLLDGSAVLSIREDSKRGVYVEGCTEVPARNPEDCFNMLRLGLQNRTFAETELNRESSRSHAILTFHLTRTTSKGGALKEVVETRFNLVDLAGSERQKLTATTGTRLKEAGQINKSLFTLASVIDSLVKISQGAKRHTHFRDSKLTFLLRDSLGGNSKTFLIANVSPSNLSISETQSTLKFASRVKMIKNRVEMRVDLEGDSAELKEEVRRLLAEVERLKSSGPMDIDHPYPPGTASVLHFTLQQSHAEKKALANQITVLQEHVARLENQVNTTKMVIKFRDQTISMLNKKQPNVPAELEALKTELELTKKALEHPPEVTRFALQNLQLTSSLEKAKDAQQLSLLVDSNLKEIERILVEMRDMTKPLEDEVRQRWESKTQLLEAELQKKSLELLSSQESLEAFKRQIQLLQQDVASLDAANDALRAKELQLHSELSSLRQAKKEESERLMQMIGELGKDLEGKSRGAESLSENMKELNRLYELEKEAVERYKSDVMMLEKTVESNLQALTQRDARIADLSHLLEQKQSLLDQEVVKSRTKDDENKTLQHGLAQRQTQIDQLRDEVDKLLRTKSESQVEIARLNSVIRTLEDRLADMEAELERLGDVERIGSEIQRNLEVVMEAKSLIEAELEQVKAQLLKAERETSELRASRSRADDAQLMSKLQASCDSLSNQNLALQDEAAQLSAVKLRLEKEMSNARNTIVDLEGKVKRMAGVQDELLTAYAEIEELKSNEDGLLQQASDYKAEVESLQSQLDDANRRIQLLSVQKPSPRKQDSAISMENDALHAQVLEYKKKATIYFEELSRLRSENARLLSSNSKQKIHHFQEIKQENNELRQLLRQMMGNQTLSREQHRQALKYLG